NIHVIKEGVTTETSSILLSKGAIENFQVVSLLSNSSNNTLDLMAAYNLLVKLKDYLSLEVDLKELELDAKKMEKQMKQVIQKVEEEQKAAEQEKDSSMYQ
ncbi:MAG: PAC2 family protein, partial [Candidatus Micrarchaeota archaeon]|nr:PAC2 family protein [Candidatus Micrarchaeota archaeon]